MSISSLIEQGLSDSAVARQLGAGWSKDKVRHWRKRNAGKAPPPVPLAPEKTVERRSNSPLTLDQLLEKFGIDLAEWEVIEFTCNRWEVGAVVDGQIITEPLYQSKARLKPRKDQSLGLIRQVLDDIKAQRPPTPTVPRVSSRAKRALEICLFDLHLAKLAWAEETGESYDLKIAQAAAEECYGKLLGLGAPSQPDTIIIPLGNDFFHYDTLGGTTTAGTVIDRDSRFAKMFRVGRALASSMIRQAMMTGAKVHVPIVPGNHDRLAMFTLGEVLSAEFSSCTPQVVVDNQPSLRKYLRYGKNLLGYTHGSEEKVKSLPGIMATERRKDWGETTHHEWHIGHLHKRAKYQTLTIDEELGCVTRYLSSLSAADGWHHASGYVGNRRAAEAFVWNADGGEEAHFTVSPNG